MSRVQPAAGLQASLLDRLTDPESVGTRARPGLSVDRMIRNVLRDLEDLLNTRRPPLDIPPNSETATSVLVYGLPDLTTLPANNEQEQAQIGRVLEDCITRFDSRLRNVRATLVRASDGTRNSIQFRIEAQVVMEPAPALAFDTVIELVTGNPTVKRSGE